MKIFVKNVSFALILLIIITTSCKKIRDDLLPVGNSKTFFQSIINPDSVIRVYAGRTTGILNRETSFIDDATVLIYENDILFDTLSPETNGRYSSYKKPSIGKQYTVKVIKDGMLTGSTIIPDSTKLSEPKIEFPTGYDAVNQQYFGELTFTIDDDPDIENFYEVIIFIKTFNNLTNSYYYFYENDLNYVLTPDKIVQNEGDWDYSPTTIFFSDKLFNGKKQQLAFSIAGGYITPDGIWISPLAEDGYILLRCISKEYYLYRKYYTRHAYNANIHSDGIQNLLFTGEPLDMYSNIDGGLGVVAAFSSTTSKIEKK
jgi:hypothetical protein